MCIVKDYSVQYLYSITSNADYWLVIVTASVFYSVGQLLFYFFCQSLYRVNWSVTMLLNRKRVVFTIKEKVDIWKKVKQVEIWELAQKHVVGTFTILDIKKKKIRALFLGKRIISTVEKIFLHVKQWKEIIDEHWWTSEHTWFMNKRATSYI